MNLVDHEVTGLREAFDAVRGWATAAIATVEAVENTAIARPIIAPGQIRASIAIHLEPYSTRDNTGPCWPMNNAPGIEMSRST